MNGNRIVLAFAVAASVGLTAQQPGRAPRAARTADTLVVYKSPT